MVSFFSPKKNRVFNPKADMYHFTVFFAIFTKKRYRAAAERYRTVSERYILPLV